MEPAPVLLLLGSLWGCSGRPADRLVVTPQEPVVPFGGSTELNCSLACAGGKVEWSGLDTALGTISSFSTHSILHIRHANVATEGTKICQGNCHGQHYQTTVTLKVYGKRSPAVTHCLPAQPWIPKAAPFLLSYAVLPKITLDSFPALPDTLRLEAAPHILRPGHPANLTCSAMHLYPPTGLALTWYRGHQVVQNPNVDCEEEAEEELYNIVSTLSVTGTEVAEGVEFRCEVTLQVGQETFTRVASLVASAEAVMEQPAAVVTSTESPSTARPVATTALPPGPGVPTGDPTTAREPSAGTALVAVTKPPSTEPSVPQDLTAGSPMARVATSTIPGSGTAATGPSVGTVPSCSLQIWSLPPTGTRGRALRIECHARCTGNATVGWLRTPAALWQYREESAGSSSALRLEHAQPCHQGRYQCVLLGHRAQMVSLEVMVVDDSFSSSPAIAVGTAGSLLGLIVTAAVSRRLWKRFRSR
ncbi:mucosal addressin cell adhesion molecule 1 isoform X1 [Vidua macroura]|uniref:mucosal addressin cell adhesion molecule 1 isoform X1 n=1 Tax=Vidua macroura TaxID=187451 RepID=UPI0023A8BC00|nr:mucosal addressin cell adhesion molecule 1 isoform X1 [Vidua macroura]